MELGFRGPPETRPFLPLEAQDHPPASRTLGRLTIGPGLRERDRRWIRPCITSLSLPDPTAIAIGCAHEVLAEVVTWADGAQDPEQVVEALRWTLAVEKLLSPRKAEGPAQTAARLLEARIGELDEPEVGGRGNRHMHGTLSRTRRHEFRLMAQYRGLVCQQAPAQPFARASRPICQAQAVDRPKSARSDETRMDLRQGDFREVLPADELLHSVDLVVTDPPYSGDYLPMWGDSSRWASMVLKPWGHLVAMGAPMLMPQYIEALSARLEYRWTIAWLMTRSVETKQYQRKSASRWKPVFVFQQIGSAPGDWMDDVINVRTREKGLHYLAAVGGWVR